VRAPDTRGRGEGGQGKLTRPILICSSLFSPSYLSSGVATLNWSLVNFRAPVSFVLYTGGLRYPTAIATAPQTVTWSNLNQPLKQRVVPGQSWDTVKVREGRGFTLATPVHAPVTAGTLPIDSQPPQRHCMHIHPAPSSAIIRYRSADSAGYEPV